MEQIIFNHLKDIGILNVKDGDTAINTIKIIENEVILSGNKFGLIMLADYITNIALSSFNSHVHLDQYNFFDDGEKQLIIELVDNNNHTNKS